MPRSLTFSFKNTEFETPIIKVDRSKLYGSVKVETLDMDGEKCDLATLLNDGKTLVPYGGTASGYLNPEGEWVRRKKITAVDFEGNPLETVESSFDEPIELNEKVDVDTFLEHSIRLTYALPNIEGMSPVLLKSLEAGDIYTFKFSYRGGVDPDPAFIMQGSDKTIWMMIGAKNRVEYAALAQAAVVAASAEDDDENTDSGELDFGML